MQISIGNHEYDYRMEDGDPFLAALADAAQEEDDAEGIIDEDEEDEKRRLQERLQKAPPGTHRSRADPFDASGDRTPYDPDWGNFGEPYVFPRPDLSGSLPFPLSACSSSAPSWTPPNAISFKKGPPAAWCTGVGVLSSGMELLHWAKPGHALACLNIICKSAISSCHEVHWEGLGLAESPFEFRLPLAGSTASIPWPSCSCLRTVTPSCRWHIKSKLGSCYWKVSSFQNGKLTLVHTAASPHNLSCRQPEIKSWHCNTSPGLSHSHW